MRAHYETADATEFLTIGDLIRRFHRSRMWFARRMADERDPFPSPARLGGRDRLWSKRLVDEWVQRRQEAEADSVPNVIAFPNRPKPRRS